MIKEVCKEEYHSIYKFAQRDIARNYFILLGLKSDKGVYEKIYGEYNEGKLQAILVKRKSGLLQFYAINKFDVDGFSEIISSFEHRGMISPKSYSKEFLNKGIFELEKKGAYISKLIKKEFDRSFKLTQDIREIEVDDLDEIVKLYRQAFNSFSPKKVMREKLKTGRGRGVCIERDGKIISVSQTDFEMEDEAVIVGVATKINFRHNGLATECLQVLCEKLIKEGKDIYLQYDNLQAGKIYEKLGFREIDRVLHLR